MVRHFCLGLFSFFPLFLVSIFIISIEQIRYLNFSYNLIKNQHGISARSIFRNIIFIINITEIFYCEHLKNILLLLGGFSFHARLFILSIIFILKKEKKSGGEDLTTLENNEGIRIEPTTKTILFAWIGVGLFIAFLIVLTSPTGVLLGESKWALASTLHGMLSIFGAVTVSVAAAVWKRYPAAVVQLAASPPIAAAALTVPFSDRAAASPARS